MAKTSAFPVPRIRISLGSCFLTYYQSSYNIQSNSASAMPIPSYAPPTKRSYDVVIVGGAAVGSSTAWWLGPSGLSVLVVERDSTYEFWSTALSTSAIRQQYSNPINVKISQFGVEFIRGFAERMAPWFPGEAAPDLGFKEHGYLYCTSPAGVDAARERVEMQRSLGAHTVWLMPEDLARQFPWLNTEDLGGASCGSQAEGWFDSMGLLNGFKRAARAQGVEYIDNRVTGLTLSSGKVTGVTLQTGEDIACGVLVNAAGPARSRSATWPASGSRSRPSNAIPSSSPRPIRSRGGCPMSSTSPAPSCAPRGPCS